ncbi:MAG: ATP-binding cassette domain-containing protein [Gammaproteobacteria bacterium]|nr:ATP-binding cassette domain-containing protein [Gammaproteobacteria bacterium]
MLSPASDDALVLRGVVRRFGSVVAVDAVDLDVAAGEILAVLGPSGCGKSTLLRVIAGLEPTDGGHVSWQGRRLDRLATHERGVGLMFQDHALFPHRDVRANVAFGLRMARIPRGRRAERVAEVLELVGLSGYDDRRVETLSGGEAQRIKLVSELAKARPQVRDPRSARQNHQTLYILDEPTVGLHMADVEKLIHVLHRLVEAGNSVIVIEHNLDLMAEADWMIDMGPEGGKAGGKLVAQGTPQKVAASKRSRTAAFLKPLLRPQKTHA